MTKNFPLPIACLTLEHIIDEVDAVEGYISEDPEAANCLPLILRNIYFLNPINKEWNLPELNVIPNADTTSRYLRALWYHHTPYDRLINAAKLGALYLMPWIIPVVIDELGGEYASGLPHIDTIEISNIGRSWLRQYLSKALAEAATNGYTDVVRLLHEMGASIETRAGVSNIITDVARKGYNDTVLYLLANEETKQSRALAVRFALGEAISTDNRTLLQSIISKYTNPSLYNTAIIWARRHNPNIVLFIDALYGK